MLRGGGGCNSIGVVVRIWYWCSCWFQVIVVGVSVVASVVLLVPLFLLMNLLMLQLFFDECVIIGSTIVDEDVIDAIYCTVAVDDNVIGAVRCS